MKEMLMNLCVLCAFAAVFDQLIQDRGSVGALRTVLGVEIFRSVLALAEHILAKII